MKQAAPGIVHIPLDFGPFGNSMVSRLNYNKATPCVELVEGGPISQMVSVLPSGNVTALQINKNFINTPELLMYLESDGTLYDQTVFSPFYSSPFYTKPDLYPALKQARMLESYAQMAKYYYKYIDAHPDARYQMGMIKFKTEFTEILDQYRSVSTRKNGRNTMAHCLYEMSFDSAIAIDATDIASVELNACYNMMSNDYYNKKQNATSDKPADYLSHLTIEDYALKLHPPEYFVGAVTFDGIKTMYERNGTITMNSLTPKQQVKFWDNLNTCYDEKTELKIDDVDARIKQFKRFYLDKNSLF